jgi:hypothetical protein
LLYRLPASIHIPAMFALGDCRIAMASRVMNWPAQKPNVLFVGIACMLLSSCAGKTPGEQLADMPHWVGGEPEGVPPRRGTPEYDSWMAARAEEAARPKNAKSK